MASAEQRLSVVVRGSVQGVGFRPFVRRLASSLALSGFVKNRRGDVLIEVEGPPPDLDRFVEQIGGGPAQIEELDARSIPRKGGGSFSIGESDGSLGAPVLPLDTATCDDCLHELFDPADRRYRYPFITCAACGPRFTIADGAPYDRERTAMAAFTMCGECAAEYLDPSDRRHHAQSIACARCGPKYALVDRAGDPIEGTIDLLRKGRIVAIKGIGGYHLACDAADEDAVALLRRRKHRPEKPFAVMTSHPERLGVIDGELLRSPARPIVLIDRSDSTIAASVAPGQPKLGVMLPYAPIHHLLLQQIDPLVMTSGNRAEEPIAHRDEDALARLAGIADAFLIHDREIRSPCDDSIHEGRIPIRRARGLAPEPIRLPFRSERRVLAVGGHLKSTFALAIDGRAVLSPHLGDLGDYRAERAFREAIDRFERIYSFAPELIACDLHPEYASTRYAEERGIPLLRVQHHHAHLAACLADNGLDERVIAVVFDGTGLGTDGTIWGGEFLVGDRRSFERAAHLRPVAMPGGEQAIREVWRMALSHLLDAGEPIDRFEGSELAARMIERRLAPMTSSAGRLFDAAACILGLCDRAGFEAQAAMQLEALAAGSDDVTAYPFELGASIDTRPLIRALARERDAAKAARRFHNTMAAIIEATVLEIRRKTGIGAVVLTGGVFQNSILLEEARSRLTGFEIYAHRKVPPNDGGLSLGQLAIGLAHLEGAR